MKIKNNLSKIIIALTLLLLFAVTISFSGCSATKFHDDDLAYVFGEVFGKKPRNVTPEDLETVESFSIMNYADNNTVTVTLSGYVETLESEGREAAATYVRTVDITDMTISEMEDFAYLKNLKSFAALYSSLQSFEFLTLCPELREVEISAAYNCTDFSYLSSIEKLEKLFITDCQVSDISFVSQMKNLTDLTLSGTYKDGYPLHDISFLEDMTSLKSLSLSSLGITDISPLANLKNLESLNLAYNGISDVTPISELYDLKFINLTQNLIEDLSSLKNYNPDTFGRIILDLNSLIKDWTPLDYLGNKVQGRH